MLPAASVCGFYFAHPQARYFALGKIGRDQVLDYHRRKGMDLRDGGALARAEPSYWGDAAPRPLSPRSLRRVNRSARSPRRRLAGLAPGRALELQPRPSAQLVGDCRGRPRRPARRPREARAEAASEGA